MLMLVSDTTDAWLPAIPSACAYLGDEGYEALVDGGIHGGSRHVVRLAIPNDCTAGNTRPITSIAITTKASNTRPGVAFASTRSAAEPREPAFRITLAV